MQGTVLGRQQPERMFNVGLAGDVGETWAPHRMDLGAGISSLVDSSHNEVAQAAGQSTGMLTEQDDELSVIWVSEARNAQPAVSMENIEGGRAVATDNQLVCNDFVTKSTDLTGCDRDVDKHETGHMHARIEQGGVLELQSSGSRGQSSPSTDERDVEDNAENGLEQGADLGVVTVADMKSVISALVGIDKAKDEVRGIVEDDESASPLHPAAGTAAEKETILKERETKEAEGPGDTRGAGMGVDVPPNEPLPRILTRSWRAQAQGADRDLPVSASRLTPVARASGFIEEAEASEDSQTVAGTACADVPKPWSKISPPLREEEQTTAHSKRIRRAGIGVASAFSRPQIDYSDASGSDGIVGEISRCEEGDNLASGSDIPPTAARTSAGVARYSVITHTTSLRRQEIIVANGHDLDAGERQDSKESSVHGSGVGVDTLSTEGSDILAETAREGILDSVGVVGGVGEDNIEKMAVIGNDTLMAPLDAAEYEISHANAVARIAGKQSSAVKPELTPEFASSGGVKNSSQEEVAKDAEEVPGESSTDALVVERAEAILGDASRHEIETEGTMAGGVAQAKPPESSFKVLRSQEPRAEADEVEAATEVTEPNSRSPRWQSEPKDTLGEVNAEPPREASVFNSSERRAALDFGASAGVFASTAGRSGDMKVSVGTPQGGIEAWPSPNGELSPGISVAEAAALMGSTSGPCFTSGSSWETAVASVTMDMDRSGTSVRVGSPARDLFDPTQEIRSWAVMESSLDDIVGDARPAPTAGGMLGITGLGFSGADAFLSPSLELGAPGFVGLRRASSNRESANGNPTDAFAADRRDDPPASTEESGKQEERDHFDVIKVPHRAKISKERLGFTGKGADRRVELIPIQNLDRRHESVPTSVSESGTSALSNPLFEDEQTTNESAALVASVHVDSSVAAAIQGRRQNDGRNSGKPAAMTASEAEVVVGGLSRPGDGSGAGGAVGANGGRRHVPRGVGNGRCCVLS